MPKSVSLDDSSSNGGLAARRGIQVGAKKVRQDAKLSTKMNLSSLEGGEEDQEEAQARMQAAQAAMEEARANEEARQRAKAMVKEGTVYFCFLTIYTLALLGAKRPGEGPYFFSTLVKDLLLEDEFLKEASHVLKTFQDVATPKEMWQWVFGSFTDSFFPNEMELNDGTPAGSIVVFDYNYLFGAVRVRSMRVKPNAGCQVHGEFESLIPACYAAVSSSTEDRAPYGPNQKWKWQSGKELGGGLPFWGLYQFYSTSGYAIDLYGNSSQITAVLEELKDEGFVDLQTRAVFYDLTLFNPGLNVYAQISVAFEFPPSGGMLPYSIIRIVNFALYEGTAGKVLLAMDIILLLFVVYYLVEEGMELKQEGWKEFAKDKWNIMDCITILCFFVVIGFRIRGLVLWSRIPSQPGDQYVNVQEIAFVTELEHVIQGTLAFLMYYKLFKYLAAIPSIRILLNTLSSAAPEVGYFLVIFGIILWSFALAGYASFSIDIRQYRTLAQAIFSVIRGTNGDLEMQQLWESNRVIGPAFYLLFYVLIAYSCITMVLAIIGLAYDEAQTQAQQAKIELNFDFITEPIKKLKKALFHRKSKNVETNLEPNETSVQKGRVTNTSWGRAAIEPVGELASSLAEGQTILSEAAGSIGEDLRTAISQRGIELNKTEMAVLEDMLMQRLNRIEDKLFYRVAPSHLSTLERRLNKAVSAIEKAAQLVAPGTSAILGDSNSHAHGNRRDGSNAPPAAPRRHRKHHAHPLPVQGHEMANGDRNVISDSRQNFAPNESERRQPRSESSSSPWEGPEDLPSSPVEFGVSANSNSMTEIPSQHARSRRGAVSVPSAAAPHAQYTTSTTASGYGVA